MAKRPVFIPVVDGPVLVSTVYVDFEWFPGMALSQAQKSIAALHLAARKEICSEMILEISSKSMQDVGTKLSAFNLKIRTLKYNQEFSVECAYQASKVFERGGPFTDLLGRTSLDAKRDPRLNECGRMTKFSFFGVDWQLEPRTAFYDWLYMNALHKQPTLAEEVLSYSAFTDIAFNPERSINCQAYAAALYVSLSKRGILDSVFLRDQAKYLEVVSSMQVSNAHENTVDQGRMTFE
ncbi:hypothetical protein GCN74_21595 [Janthinobacterium sp. FT14W]|uniref:DarT1-associated NADAR antitoxin family protein n=1 Tax=Janthinobacterium sp. FT14W TaxID=2654253 RepID=UPI001264588D|nr:hypothetical protein [Janthinobacterium sp. FT14W]KAB8057165.1 hypothetical protein GCN74_21595 [Janthinobacterium sp. FT14W]